MRKELSGKSTNQFCAKRLWTEEILVPTSQLQNMFDSLLGRWRSHRLLV